MKRFRALPILTAVLCSATALLLTGCPPPVSEPTYADNALNWRQGPLTITGQAAVNGLEVTVSAKGTDPSPGGGISACSYNFGDNTPPVEVTADLGGNCAPAVHTYAEAGAYGIVGAVWDKKGMVRQDGAMVQVGQLPGISARSGTHIAGCLETYWWLPDQGGPFPALVHYTPYPVDEPGPPMSNYLVSGVAVVLVTNRGQGSSCGTPDLFGEVAQQDLLLIEQWLAEQTWATGDYCLYGHSGPGIMGTLSGARGPARLRCAVLGGGDTEMWDGLVTKSGAWWPIAPLWVLGTYGEAALLDPVARIPVLVDLLTATHRHTRSADFFDARDVTVALRSLNVPVLFETSWDDLAWGGGHAGGPYLEVVQELLHPGSAMIIFAGPHHSVDPSNQIPYTSYPGSGGGYTQEMRQFILSTLKGGAPPDTTQFNYHYFQLKGGAQAAVMNRRYGGWKKADSWPPAGTQPVSLYLAPDRSGTVSARHDGSLLAAAPLPAQSLGPFPYQPAPYWDPVYSSGSTPWNFYTFPDLRRADKAALAFTSPPLAADAVVQGPATLTLTAQTELYDHDWMAVLSDVWPDGSSHRLSSGFTRVSLRNRYDTYEPAPAGDQTYTLALASVANVFQKGHRLRLTLHQMNADDSSAPARRSWLRLGAGKAALTLYADSGLLPLQAYQVCTDCDPDAEATETLAPHLDEYVTGAVKGRDPVSGREAGAAFVASTTGTGAVQGRTALFLQGEIYAGADVQGMAATSEPGYDYRLELSNGYEMLVGCGRDGGPGSVLLDTGTLTVGPLEISDGSVRCYDTPYVNW